MGTHGFWKYSAVNLALSRIPPLKTTNNVCFLLNLALQNKYRWVSNRTFPKNYDFGGNVILETDGSRNSSVVAGKGKITHAKRSTYASLKRENWPLLVVR